MSFEWNTVERFDKLDAALLALAKLDAPLLTILQGVLIVVKSNEQIVAKLVEISAKLDALHHLSPDDQAKLNKIFATATGDSAKIDVAISPNL